MNEIGKVHITIIVIIISNHGYFSYGFSLYIRTKTISSANRWNRRTSNLGNESKQEKKTRKIKSSNEAISLIS